MILFAIKFKNKYLAFEGDTKNPSVVWVTSKDHEKVVRRSEIRAKSLLKMLPPGAKVVSLEDTLR